MFEVDFFLKYDSVPVAHDVIHLLYVGMVRYLSMVKLFINLLCTLCLGFC